VLIMAAMLIAGIVMRTSSDEGARSMAGIIFSIAPTAIILIILIFLYVTVEKFRHREKMQICLPGKATSGFWI